MIEGITSVCQYAAEFGEGFDFSQSARDAEKKQ